MPRVHYFTDIAEEPRRPATSRMNSQDLSFEAQFDSEMSTKGGVSGDRVKSAKIPSTTPGNTELPLTTVINVRQHQETGYNVDRKLFVQV